MEKEAATKAEAEVEAEAEVVTTYGCADLVTKQMELERR